MSQDCINALLFILLRHEGYLDDQLLSGTDGDRLEPYGPNAGKGGKDATDSELESDIH